MGLYNRFCKRFFASVIIRLTAQSDLRAPTKNGTSRPEKPRKSVPPEDGVKKRYKA